MFNEDNNADLDEAMNVYLRGCKRNFEDYKILIDKHKLNRQDARGVLPLDTATRCIYTYSILNGVLFLIYVIMVLLVNLIQTPILLLVRLEMN